ncbi:MAG: DUF3516 domain-containing protein [Myxococcales bacterium]|nr:DUF3516 domain-containing protein [Myxococcales bacterium]
MSPSPPLSVEPSACPLDADAILERFLAYVEGRGLSLYPAQEEAVLEIFAGKNVVLDTPTGSGKSLVATAMCWKAIAEGRRVYYTAPIKALVSEKFFAACDDFGPTNVGLVTGDAAVNPDAPVICCTAEILSNRCLREGSELDVAAVVMDEFHYYGDRDRGVAWQVPLLTLKHARFLLMSATLGPMDAFVERLEALTGDGARWVRGQDRPVPLDFEYRETPLHETIAELCRGGRAPVYVVSFTQRACAELAQDLLSTDLCTKDEKKRIAEAIAGHRFDGSPYGKEVQKLLRHGVAIHHAGLLPRYRLLVEKLAQQGLLRVVCGTDTLGVGVNVPIRTVLFTQLCKWDGQKTAILPVRDFRQISGRAGRKGFDERGYVVAQAPEHVIENLRLEEKAQKDPSKKKKIVKKKPPEHGFVPWDRTTFARLCTAPPEPLVSRFSVSHGMLLAVLRRPNGCREMIRLVRRAHETDGTKRKIGAHARTLFRSLVDGGIIERKEGGIELDLDLQEDFSLNHALALWLVDTARQLDPASPDYALDLLTLAESICEDPDVVLMRQLDKMKGDLVAQLKAQGVEYEERMKRLEELEYPKPLRELVYDSFNAFARLHPWVGENIRPKSVAREMVETLAGFSDYVKRYGLQRSEGVLLRYLSEVYKVMVQSVPAWAKNDAVEDIVDFLGAVARQADASLLEEWERLRDPVAALMPKKAEDLADAWDITRDKRGFGVLIRNACYRLLEALSVQDFEAFRELVVAEDGAGEAWTDARVGACLAEFRADHPEGLRLDRSPRLLTIEPGDVSYRLQQVVPDVAGDDDWVLEMDCDLAASKAAQRPVLRLDRFGR